MGKTVSEVWTKAIPRSLDRRQSAALVGVLAPLLLGLCGRALLGPVRPGVKIAMMLLSLTFAGVVWRVRAGTAAASLCGAMVCLLIGLEAREVRGLTALGLLFALTLAATRAGRARKTAMGVAEERRGRSAAQVLANLGAAGLFAATPALMLAALAEATADTLASELGQAYGGLPVLLTSGERVPAGTDGAVSVLGTLAGVAGAGLVTLAGWGTLALSGREALEALGAGLMGFVADTLLGATVERRAWLGNDLVNFASTLVAVLTAWALMRWG